jgi:hypothetical protein
MTLKLAVAPRCSNGERCVAYPALGQAAKLSRGNPGPKCFACEERRATSNLKAASARVEEVVERGRASELPNRGKSTGLEQKVGWELAEAGQHARAVLERRRRSVLTCKRGLRSALACGDERLVRRWSRSLREAEDRLVWAEADLQATETKAHSGQAPIGA